jgi:hypothetical protein
MDRREMDAARRMGDAVRDMLENVDRWAAAYHRLHGQSVGNDYLAREAREALDGVLTHVETLLNFDLGGRDGGDLSRYLNHVRETHEISEE